MRINPEKRKLSANKRDEVNLDKYTRQAALVFVFLGVFFFVIKILFL